jgi:DNA-directed RNA polymerase I, II, and III subunit RPABC2
MPPKSKNDKSIDKSIDNTDTKAKTKVVKQNLSDDVDFAEDDKQPELEEVDDINEEQIDEHISKERYEYTPTIIREVVYVLPENRRTSEILTKFECTEIISNRAVQIEQGGTCYTDTSMLSDPLQMARKELLDKKCPLDVVRGITDVLFERWHVNEMGLPADF